MGGASKQVSTGIYQADTVLAKIFAKGNISVVASNEACFLMRLGKECAQMKDFVLDSKSK